MNKSEELLHWGFHSHFCRYRTGTVIILKKALMILLAVCLLTSLLTGVLAEGHLEGKPWVNPEWPENVPDERPALENDFYLFVNYDLHRQPPMKTDSGSGDSIGTRIEKELADDIWKLVDAGESTEAKCLRILSSLIMDTDRREKEGLEPLMAYIRQVKAAKTVDELSAICRQEGFLFSSPYATFQLERSLENPDQFVIQIYENEVMPRLRFDADEPQPTKEEDWFDKKRAEEELILLGWEPDRARQLTERLARYELDSRTYQANGPETYETEQEQLPTLETIMKTCAPLADQTASLGLSPADASAANVFENADLSVFRYMQNQYRDENLELFKAIICLSMYHYAMDYLDLATYAKAHDAEDVSTRQAAYEYMLTHTRFLAEQAYAAACISPELYAQVKDLAEECKGALADRMRRCEWLSEESRLNAVKKAESMEVVIVTPEERTDYGPLLAALSREGISLLDAAIQYDAMERHTVMRLAGKPYVRGHRFLNSDPLIAANAVYEPTKNTFYIMAGVLKPAFCNTASRETLLATLGQTIAHEMSHGFENYGVEYGWDGSQSCVLTEEDKPKFQERVQRMAGSLSQIELADGVMLNGSHTFFEAAADLMGLQVVLDLAKETEAFDYDLFFQTLGRKFYRSFMTRDEAISDYESNGHPAHFVRANYIFAQVDEFYLAYPAIQEGTGMYCAPENRVSLW